MASAGSPLASSAPSADTDNVITPRLAREHERAAAIIAEHPPAARRSTGPTVKQVVIENPILNSPFEEPCRHFRFGEEGITNEIVPARRSSSYFIPIPAAKKKGKSQLVLDTEWVEERIEENAFINSVRTRVARWRETGRLGMSRTTARLLEYWTDPEREKKLFFCQIEALETAIYITEAAPKLGDHFIENHLRQAAQDANPLLYRMALKMATGSGK